MKNKVLSKKWKRLLRHIYLFKYIPFLDFVLVAGSLAIGNVHEKSDFDVIIGAREGRIFTVRLLVLGVFGVFGLRRKGYQSKSEASDRFCFNHFVTPVSYRLSPPHNAYWRTLYRNIVPVYGKEEAVKKFFDANRDWVTRSKEIFNQKYWQSQGGILKYTTLVLEILLGGWMGDWIEKVAKKYQVWRIKKNLPHSLGYKPLVRFDDEELRFHMDTKRIEKMVKML